MVTRDPTMMSTGRVTGLAAGRLAIVVTILVQALLAWIVLDPSVGFDDANITQAYARNIAAGHGYVYNLGGERVEGSTSFLWTLLNVAGFALGRPILFVTTLGFLITAATLDCVRATASALSRTRSAGVVAVLLFNFFPAYFAWSLWSLMDAGLFVLAIAALTTSIFAMRGRARMASVVGVSALLPLIRPEGIVVACGVAAYLAVAARRDPDFGGVWWKGAAAAVASLAAVTAFRIGYFGYPAPNTFYAKTSTDVAGQTVQGLHYVWDWLGEPQNFALVLLTGLACGGLAASAGPRRLYAAFVVFLIAGGVLTYTILGGDHFGGGRFLLFILPLALPAIAVASADRIRPAEDRTGWAWSGALAGLSLVVCAGFVAAKFAVTDYGLARELRYAEAGRDLGQRLNAAVGPDRSVAVIAAGGVRMGYDGVIYDVLGLNWSRMAHSQTTVATGRPKNHGGFVDAVFLEARPDIAFPHRVGCDRIGERLLSDFGAEVIGDFDIDPRFTGAYTLMCNADLAFYARDDLVAELEASGFWRAVPVAREPGQS
jgi:arabinofuranosyltransferase